MSPRRKRRRHPAAPIPATVKRWLQAGILAIIVTAAVGNVGHTFTHVDKSGQHGWYAAAMAVTPDVGVLIGVTLLTFRRRSFWGWLIITGSAAFVSWSAFSVAGTPVSDKVVALAPVGFAAIGAGLLESIRGESAELVLAHAEALAEDAERTARAAIAQAHADASGALEQARTATARIADLEASLEAARQAHETDRESARAALEEARRAPAQTPPVRPTAKRTAGARKPVARATAQGGDLQRRAAAREAYMASVRAGRALDNAALARLIYGVDATAQPDGGQLRAASARASEWRRAVERETDDQEAHAAGGDR